MDTSQRTSQQTRAWCLHSRSRFIRVLTLCRAGCGLQTAEMEWSEAETFQFLELFQKEPIIWDPKHKHHKNNQKVNDAWVRLSEEMCRPSTDLKNKKNSLMATFRHHLRRKKQSLKSGAGEDDVYKPVWLYYDTMETFLASVYKCHTTINTEEGPEVVNTEEGLNEGLVSKLKLHIYLVILYSLGFTCCYQDNNKYPHEIFF